MSFNIQSESIVTFKSNQTYEYANVIKHAGNHENNIEKRKESVPAIQKIPKILVDSGSHAKNFGTILNNQTTNYLVKTIIKPDASDTDIIKVALTNAEVFSI